MLMHGLGLGQFVPITSPIYGGVLPTCNASLDPSTCAANGGNYNGDTESCDCSISSPVVATPALGSPASGTPALATSTMTPGGTTITPYTGTPFTSTPVSCNSATNPCGWTDYIWASNGCLNWLGQCNPTNFLYTANTQGLLAATGQSAGQAIGNTAGGVFAGLGQATGIPPIAWIAGLGLLAFSLLKR